MESLVFYDEGQGGNVTALAIGTVAPRSSDDTRLRVYNTSDTYQAQDVVVAVGGSAVDQLFLSEDGDTFGVEIEIGDIPPLGGSAPFTLRRVTPSTATPGGFTATLSATPAAWAAPVDGSASDNVPLPTSDDE